MARWADAKTVADKAAGWTDAQIDCRLYRHDWTRRLTLVTHGKGFYQVAQTCARLCGVSRHTVLNNQGYQVEGWTMDYRNAQGYLMTDERRQSLGRIDASGRAAIWREALMSMSVTEVTDE